MFAEKLDISNTYSVCIYCKHHSNQALTILSKCSGTNYMVLVILDTHTYVTERKTY